MGALIIATANRPQTGTRWRIRRFDARLEAKTIFRLVSHGTQNPISISTFGSYGLERYKLWNFIGVVLENLRLNLLKLGTGGFNDELHLAIHNHLFLPVVHGLNPVDNVHTGGQAPLDQ
jgi:hypothetical protein